MSETCVYCGDPITPDDAITDPRNEESSWSSRRGLFVHRMLPDSREGDRLCVTS